MTSQAKGRGKLLDVAALGEEYGPNRFFWPGRHREGTHPNDSTTRLSESVRATE